MGGENAASDPRLGLRQYLTIYGSVVPRSIPWAVFGAIEGALFKWGANETDSLKTFRYHVDGGGWYHPYAFHVFGMMLGFALVMRIQVGAAAAAAALPPPAFRLRWARASSAPGPHARWTCVTRVRVLQIAYQRYWEGTTQCHQASAKWADAVMQVMAFDEASKDAFSEDGLEFRMLILHYTSLMSAPSAHPRARHRCDRLPSPGGATTSTRPTHLGLLARALARSKKTGTSARALCLSLTRSPNARPRLATMPAQMRVPSSTSAVTTTSTAPSHSIGRTLTYSDRMVRSPWPGARHATAPVHHTACVRVTPSRPRPPPLPPSPPRAPSSDCTFCFDCLPPNLLRVPLRPSPNGAPALPLHRTTPCSAPPPSPHH